MTLLDIIPFLLSPQFRARILRRVKNPEVRRYFEARFNRASDAMQAVLAGPVLNKVAGFSADPHFRHILGQQHSTFSLVKAMDERHWVILTLPKGRLGEEATTLASLFLPEYTNALFSRRGSSLCTLYADEVQNLVASDSSLEVLLSEGRKFHGGVVTGNQFLDQLPSVTRSAILAIGTNIFFQLSSADASHVSTALGGGKSLAELLKNLPHRQFVLKTGNEPWRQLQSRHESRPKSDFSDLLRRSRERWARRRTEIEHEIQARQADAMTSHRELLRDWE